MKKETLEQVTEDSPCGGKGWCFLREYFLHLGSDRSAMQIRLMLDYRYVLGKKLGREVTDEEAFESWVTEGYASKFAEIYRKEEAAYHQSLKKQLFGDV